MLKFKAVKKAKSFNHWTLKMDGVTEGMLLATHRALQLYCEQSAVGNDVFFVS